MSISTHLSLRLPADADSLPVVRRELRSWLARAGVEGTPADDIVLASWEACANAVEHPVEPDATGEIDVEASLSAERVCVQVRDTGRWRERRAHRAHRGLGLQLVRALMHDVSIQPQERGTEVRMCRSLEGASRGAR